MRCSRERIQIPCRDDARSSRSGSAARSCPLLSLEAPTTPWPWAAPVMLTGGTRIRIHLCYSTSRRGHNLRDESSREGRGEVESCRGLTGIWIGKTVRLQLATPVFFWPSLPFWFSVCVAKRTYENWISWTTDEILFSEITYGLTDARMEIRSGFWGSNKILAHVRPQSLCSVTNL
jgi:hypothetical protein